MVSRKEKSTMKLMYRLIISHGYLGRSELQTKAGNISVGKYNQLKSYFEEEYQDEIAYDKPRKIWYALNPVDEEIRREMVNLELLAQ